jgi:ethanolamine utilization protein EutM
MTAKALGLIETIGLAAAIEAADAAAKSANVTVLGYENARGGGRITVKLLGDVGAVRAAVTAGSAAALRMGKVDGCLVIPRPHEEIEALLAQLDRGQARTPSSQAAHVDSEAAHVDSEAAHVDSEAAHVDNTPAHVDNEVSTRRKPAPVRRGKLPKSDPPVAPESGEIEGQ